MGAGLIGTSVALAARRAGWRVEIVDRDGARETAARSLVAGAGGDPAALAEKVHADPHRTASAPAVPTEETSVSGEPDLICVAVHPAATAEVVSDLLRRYIDSTVIDVASVKTEPQRQVEMLGGALARFVPTHPLAGSEGSGPRAARPDLFRGRTWVVCADAATDPARLVLVEGLVRDCLAHPVRLGAAEHDRLVAVTSHLPQVVASALAGVVDQVFADPPAAETAAATSRRQAAQPGRPGVVPSVLAGPALLDMTRIAASPAELWAQIAGANVGPLRDATAALVERLARLRDELSGPDSASSAVRDLVQDGADARARMGFKHAGAPATQRRGSAEGWTWVDSAVDDTPGALARIFAEAARVGVNVEDVLVDHAPFASAGVVSVAVRDPDDAHRLAEALYRSLD